MLHCGRTPITSVAAGLLCLILTVGADTDLAEEQYGVKYASKCEGNSCGNGSLWLLDIDSS